MATNLFNPIMGPEERVQQCENSAGALYFTTDTRKIYLDIDNNKLPMGGNVNLFYGKMKPQGFVGDDQEEFEFTIDDIIKDETTKLALIPNVNDLILNNDGCFYKVLSVDGDHFNTRKLTIAGSGGGGGGGSDPNNLTSFKVGNVDYSTTSVIQGNPCILRFVVKATDDIGNYISGDVGYCEIWINGAPVIKNIRLKGISSGDTTDDINNFPEEEINTIDISSYLPAA